MRTPPAASAPRCARGYRDILGLPCDIVSPQHVDVIFSDVRRFHRITVDIVSPFRSRSECVRFQVFRSRTLRRYGVRRSIAGRVDYRVATIPSISQRMFRQHMIVHIRRKPLRRHTRYKILAVTTKESMHVFFPAPSTRKQYKLASRIQGR